MNGGALSVEQEIINRSVIGGDGCSLRLPFTRYQVPIPVFAAAGERLACELAVLVMIGYKQPEGSRRAERGTYR